MIPSAQWANEHIQICNSIVGIRFQQTFGLGPCINVRIQ